MERDEVVHVERTVEVEGAPDDLWELLVDDDERAGWFGGPTTLEPVPGGAGTFTDPDGSRRAARVDVVEPGRRIAWTWWPEGDDGDGGASRVEVVLHPVPGGTSVTVVERPLAPATQASVAGGALPLLELELAVLLRATRLLVLA